MTGLGRVTARVDANSRVGLGHLRRSQVLLEELSRRGSSIGFVGSIDSQAARAAGPALRNLMYLASPACAAHDPVSDAEESLAALGSPDPSGSWVVVDHYELGESWERIVSAAGHRILAIDDLRDRPHCAEILVSDTAEPFSPAVDRWPSGALQLLGPSYALLGPEFNAIEKTVPSPAAGLRLLITFGGADSTREGFKVLQALGDYPGSVAASLGVGAVDLVLGPACEQREELIRQSSALSCVVIHDAPLSLAPLMYAADLVVTAGGNSLVEALAIGRPCLVIQTAENQARMVRSLEEESLILSLGDHRDVTPESISAGLARLGAIRLDLAERLAENPVFDTRGAGRIARAMEGRSARPTVEIA